MGNGLSVVGLGITVNAVLHLSSSLKASQEAGMAVINWNGSSLCLFIYNRYFITLVLYQGMSESRKANLLSFFFFLKVAHVLVQDYI